MMFQRAPPEVNGFGVITFTPGFTTSFQPVMCFGLPLRTARTTTESVTIPLCGPAFHDAGTRPSLTSRLTSGSSENSTTTACSPPSTARLWSPEAPYDSLNLIPPPAGVAWNAGMRAAYASFGVEYATRLIDFAPPELPPQAATVATTVTVATAASTVRPALCRFIVSILDQVCRDYRRGSLAGGAARPVSCGCEAREL